MANILTNLVSKNASSDPEIVAFTTISGPDAEILPVSWAEFDMRRQNLAMALETLGVGEQDRIAVFAPNMGETLIADFAAYTIRAIPVSLYPTSSPSQVEYILKDSKAKVVFIGSARQYNILREVVAGCPDIVATVTMSDDIETDTTDSMTLRLEELYEMGNKASDLCRQEVERRSAEAQADDVATLIYTSGTTGEPKGTILPHSCFNAQLECHRNLLTMVSENDTSMCFLPLSHIFEKAWTYFCLWMKIRVTVNYNPREIQKTLQRVKPTCMCSVPRFWEKAYTAIQEKFDHSNPIVKKIFKGATQTGMKRNLDYVRKGRPVPVGLKIKYSLYEKAVYSKIREAIGIPDGNIFPTAGAPLSDEIVEFFRAMGIKILIGYGLSETTATVSCYPEENYVIGSVGQVIPDVEVRIGQEDEILVKGPTVMRGYFNKPEETAHAFTDDGWFRTGDAGHFDEEGNLVLTERIKDLFKTSNGKYIAPQALESRLGADPYIEQVAVIGDRRKYVTAIIIPAFEALKQYARHKKIQYRNIDDLIRNTDIRALISSRIEKLQSGLPSFEQIKKFTLLPKEFTIESGEITNTLKLCRNVISSHYSREIEAMYA